MALPPLRVVPPQQEEKFPHPSLRATRLFRDYSMRAANQVVSFLFSPLSPDFNDEPVSGVPFPPVYRARTVFFSYSVKVGRGAFLENFPLHVTRHHQWTPLGSLFFERSRNVWSSIKPPLLLVSRLYALRSTAEPGLLFLTVFSS